MNRLTSEWLCEGCDAGATCSDSEGVPLCDDCYESLIQSTKEEIEEKERTEGQ